MCTPPRPPPPQFMGVTANPPAMITGERGASSTGWREGAAGTSRRACGCLLISGFPLALPPGLQPDVHHSLLPLLLWAPQSTAARAA